MFGLRVWIGRSGHDFFLVFLFFLQSGVVRHLDGKLLVEPGTGSTGINRVERIVFDSVAFSLRPVLFEPPFAI